MRHRLLITAFATLIALPPANAEPLPTADGFRGIWYMNQPTKDHYKYKYSGGMATYPQQIAPHAVYDAGVKKTFFVYGGTDEKNSTVFHCISYFDHKTGLLARPRVLLDKKTDDAHDNPCLAIDEKGHLWIFSNSHGTTRPSYIHRSTKPGSIEKFEKVMQTNFSYGQAWHLGEHGFVFLHTRYEKGVRNLYQLTSPDGAKWSEPAPLSRIPRGQYQVSWSDGRRVATAFDHHPNGNLNARTNIYFLITDDAGKTWKTAAGEPVKRPLDQINNPALVHDYAAEGLLVYLKDIQFDDKGNPVILYLTSKSHEPGPAGGERLWRTARWTGKEWEIRPVTTSDHNYDHGSLYIEHDAWRIIAPTDPGPQAGGTGGEMVLWESADQGKTWKRIRNLTQNSKYNHTYARRPLYVNAGFYALWADGDAFAPSESRLYFTDKEAKKVWRLPVKMEGEFAKPEEVPAP